MDDFEEHMSPEQLKEWQEHMEYTTEEAAESLGLSVNGYLNYLRGFRYLAGAGTREVIIPKTVALACAAIATGIEEYEDINLEG